MGLQELQQSMEQNPHTEKKYSLDNLWCAFPSQRHLEEEYESQLRLASKLYNDDYESYQTRLDELATSYTWHFFYNGFYETDPLWQAMAELGTADQSVNLELPPGWPEP